MNALTDLLSGWDAGFLLAAGLLVLALLSMTGLVYLLVRERRAESEALRDWAQPRVVDPLKTLGRRIDELEEKLADALRLQQDGHDEVCERLRSHGKALMALNQELEKIPDRVRKKLHAASRQTAPDLADAASDTGDEPPRRPIAADRLYPGREPPAGAPPRPAVEERSYAPQSRVERPKPNLRQWFDDLPQRHRRLLEVSRLTADLLPQVLKLRSDLPEQSFLLPFHPYREVAFQHRKLESLANDPSETGAAIERLLEQINLRLEALSARHKEIDFLDLLESSRDLPAVELRRKLLDSLGLEEVLPEVGSAAGSSRDLEFENTDSSGSEKVVREVVRAGFRKRSTHELLRRPRVRI